MRKQGRKEELVQSKYFSIDSYFKSPPNKKIKTAFHDQIEQQLSTLETKKEQCPLCCTLISVESVSMEVHVNGCLDTQQDKAGTSKEKKFGCAVDSSQNQQFENVISQCEMTENDVTEGRPVKHDVTELNDKAVVEEKVKEREDNAQVEDVTLSSVVQHNDNNVKPASGIGRILPSSWKSLFSSSSTLVTPLVPRSTSNALNPPLKKQRLCPFYKRVRGNIFTSVTKKKKKLTCCFYKTLDLQWMRLISER